MNISLNHIEINFFSCKSLKTGASGRSLGTQVPSNLLVHCPWVFAFFSCSLGWFSSHLPSSQGKGNAKNGPQRTRDSHSQLTGQNLITPGAREVGNIALNSECIQPKFRGSTTEDKRQSKGLRTLKLLIVYISILWICILLSKRPWFSL